MNIPVLKQCPSPNYSPTPINHDLVILHDMEGGYEGSVAYLCLSRVKASAHLCMNDDGSEFMQLVPLNYKAWAECNSNGRGISIEMPGFVAKGFSDTTLRGLAWATAWLLQAYGIPCQYAPGGVGRGICTHHDLGPAGGGHVDFCGVNDATWQKFLGFVKEQYDAFAAMPSLPLWALHGLPAPHAVSLPPAVTPEASHGGAPRNSPGDQMSHPTPSTYPHGSLADIQSRLNEVGANIAVDGQNGPLTIQAIRNFQRMNSLFVDGLIGPNTWAKLAALTK